MTPFSSIRDRSFVVATPMRALCDDNARALYHHGKLRFFALGTRRGAAGVPLEYTRLKPSIGLVAYAAARTFSTTRAESLRFRLHPWYDRWVLKQLEPGNHVISSYGYVNACFAWARRHGGRTFLDGGNSHPDNYWEILAEENRRWNVPDPPIARHHYERAKAMLEHVDYVLSPSSFVSRSFTERGFKPSQILRNVYPLDLSCFKPPDTPRDKNRSLTIVSTGALSLRKGTPYLLEAFRLVLQRHPTARLRLTRVVQDNAQPVLAKYRDLPIDWSPSLPHPQLAEWLRTSDLFVLPSLEDGFARTVTEAMACGLPVITTPNTGASDWVEPGKNGEVVPIRDPRAIADALLKWADRMMDPQLRPRITIDHDALSFETFEREFMNQLAGLNLG